MPRTKGEVLVDRQKIAQLYVRGCSMREIGLELNLSATMVHREVSQIREEWKAAYIHEWGEMLLMELARLDELESTYWKAWERSQDDQRRHQAFHVDQDGNPVADRLDLVTGGSAGDPRFLAGVQWCIEKRCRLLRLEPASQEIGGGRAGQREKVDVYASNLQHDSAREKVAAVRALLVERSHTSPE